MESLRVFYRLILFGILLASLKSVQSKIFADVQKVFSSQDDDSHSKMYVSWLRVEQRLLYKVDVTVEKLQFL